MPQEFIISPTMLFIFLFFIRHAVKLLQLLLLVLVLLLPT